MDRYALGLPAPAKLNLFLHVVGRRADGYHELQTAFVPIDLCDRIDLVAYDSGSIDRTGDVVGNLEQDLALRAANALKTASGTKRGVSICVLKKIPAGSGMGGGSSDAATTLIGLNHLWGLHWPRERLANLAIALGADVPFFLQPGPAVAEGVGEQLSPLPLPAIDAWAVVVHPQVHVATQDIFTDPRLTRDTKRTKLSSFSVGGACLITQFSDARGACCLWGKNDLEHVAVLREAVIGEVIAALRSAVSKASLKGESESSRANKDGSERDARDGSEHLIQRVSEPSDGQGIALSGSLARMTGSGAACFSIVSGLGAAEQVAQDIKHFCKSGERSWSIWVVRVLAEHPLSAWLAV